MIDPEQLPRVLPVLQEHHISLVFGSHSLETYRNKIEIVLQVSARHQILQVAGRRQLVRVNKGDSTRKRTLTRGTGGVASPLATSATWSFSLEPRFLPMVIYTATRSKDSFTLSRREVMTGGLELRMF